MNSFAGKRLLALVRDGDYAHAGEEEAIERVFGDLPKRSDRWLLDVGCGRGGTADYLRKRGWGRVVGLDRDGESLAYARARYPEVEFVEREACAAPRYLPRRFTQIYLLNVYYALEAQRDALLALRQVAEEGAELRIFDYLDRGGFAEDPLEVDGESIVPHPVVTEAVSRDLAARGWRLLSVELLSEEYRGWYAALARRIEKRAPAIVDRGGEEALAYLRAVYRGILGKIEAGLLGGVLVRAAAA
ncbi:bifunctional 2-polyprenyl-6-hydroxyphenol methylase/3-demethylubiquinol 3-O-methyltransferase UbiG [Methylacidimicrobium sp. B4]|uniref:class I SAM-dependent methyltransferase n=1 Tax=Methylacidimicrobium sp. B4 TaxID=2796139 RepID=UPI001A8C39A3|nr:class I SAM-dependent methyltransferase [Methylacidimicrobium sp. B4]QSR84649.1 class I SAM-dependent methyltransferase [Methylacidimicrobium sp. B4]